MNYINQIRTVTLWEFRRFYKLKNELLGIVIMLAIFSISYFGMRYALSGSDDKAVLTVAQNIDPVLTKMLLAEFEISSIPQEETDGFIKQISETKEGLLLLPVDENFVIHAWKKPRSLSSLQEILNSYQRQLAIEASGLSLAEFSAMMLPASLTEFYFQDAGQRGGRVPAFFFAGLMILAIFLSFAYQFTAITGEKQLRITEQIVSAIRPQVWMDGKILGIALTGISSMLTYMVISILGGMLFFQFSNVPLGNIMQYIHLPSIALFFIFSLMGILLWNAALAAIASVITDPNNSAKSSLMMLPVVFVLLSFLVIREPDSGLALFLSWFPLTSATALPVRWVVTEVPLWHLPGSFAVLTVTFYIFRKLAAKIFRVSILMSGKEPSWGEVWKLAGEE